MHEGTSVRSPMGVARVSHLVCKEAWIKESKCQLRIEEGVANSAPALHVRVACARVRRPASVTRIQEHCQAPPRECWATHSHPESFSMASCVCVICAIGQAPRITRAIGATLDVQHLTSGC